MESIKILFEDKNILVINKPAGLVVHADGRTVEPNVAEWVLKNYRDTADVGEPIIMTNGEKILRPGIVHRLDRETSGALLIAKNQKAFDFLKEKFQNKKIKKIYHAFVYGIIKDDEGTINRPIGRSKKNFRLRSAQRFASGELREAITDYRVLRRGTDFTFVEVIPRTGRTHQIRAHFKAVNHPIVTDKLYAPKREPALGFNRLALHAKSLEFENIDGEILKIEAPYPDDFTRAQKLLN